MGGLFLGCRPSGFVLGLGKIHPLYLSWCRLRVDRLAGPLIHLGVSTFDMPEVEFPQHDPFTLSMCRVPQRTRGIPPIVKVLSRSTRRPCAPVATIVH